MAEAALPVMDLDYMRRRFAGNDAACNPGLQFAKFDLCDITQLLAELRYDAANAIPTHFCADPSH